MGQYAILGHFLINNYIECHIFYQCFCVYRIQSFRIPIKVVYDIKGKVNCTNILCALFSLDSFTYILCLDFLKYCL